MGGNLLRNINTEITDISTGEKYRVNDPEAHIRRLAHFSAGLGAGDQLLDPGHRTISGKTLVIGPGNKSSGMATFDVSDEGADMSYPQMLSVPWVDTNRAAAQDSEAAHRSPYSVWSGIDEGKVYGEVHKSFAEPSPSPSIRKSAADLIKRVGFEGRPKFWDPVGRNTGGGFELDELDEDGDERPFKNPYIVAEHFPEYMHGHIKQNIGNISHFGDPISLSTGLRSVRDVFGKINRTRRGPVAEVPSIDQTILRHTMRNDPHMMSPQFTQVNLSNPRMDTSISELPVTTDMIDLKTGTWAKIDPEGYFPD